MNLARISLNQSTQERLALIDANLGQVCGPLLASETQLLADRLALTQRAVEIKDEGDREAFMRLIAAWANLCKRETETLAALRFVRSQLDHAEKQEILPPEANP
jgi:hypothetical protein